MIIVSQDKTKIVNFDNLTQIYITHCEEDKTGYFIRFETVDSLYEDLGEYQTEERAKEVLEEIVYVYEHMKYLQTFQNRLMEFDEKPNFVYEMPEE